MLSSLKSDLDEVLDLTSGLWDDLRGARILVTGGTGFIGTWLLASLVHANQRHDLDLEAVVLTRNPEGFRKKIPHLADSPEIHLVPGDVCQLPALAGSFTHLIHAATDASAQLLTANPHLMFDTIVSGTRAVLEVATEKAIGSSLFLSSGAVYGRQPHDLERIPEDWNGLLDCADPRSAYAEGKRAAETLCGIHAHQHGLAISIARCFAFVGPYLPLDSHFAIGNFIGDALAGKTIRVKGDGTPYRSYLYATDLTAWLWHLLVRGESGVPFNVGSEEAVSIRELAAQVGQELNSSFEILGQAAPHQMPERYVPSTEHIRQKLGLSQTVSLQEGIRRTARWHADRQICMASRIP